MAAVLPSANTCTRTGDESGSRCMWVCIRISSDLIKRDLTRSNWKWMCGLTEEPTRCRVGSDQWDPSTALIVRTGAYSIYYRHYDTVQCLMRCTSTYSMPLLPES